MTKNSAFVVLALAFALVPAPRAFGAFTPLNAVGLDLHRVQSRGFHPTTTNYPSAAPPASIPVRVEQIAGDINIREFDQADRRTRERMKRAVAAAKHDEEIKRVTAVAKRKEKAKEPELERTEDQGRSR